MAFYKRLFLSVRMDIFLKTKPVRHKTIIYIIFECDDSIDNHFNTIDKLSVCMCMIAIRRFSWSLKLWWFIFVALAVAIFVAHMYTLFIFSDLVRKRTSLLWIQVYVLCLFGFGGGCVQATAQMRCKCVRADDEPS